MIKKVHYDQNYSNLTKEQFELSESISNWTEAQRAELTFHLLTTLPPYQVTQIVDRISPYIYRNILCQLPYEIAINILSFLDTKSLIQASQVSKGWHTLCEDSNLWKRLYEAEGWQYNQQEIDDYLNKDSIHPIPIQRSSSPFIPRKSTLTNRLLMQSKETHKADEKLKYHHDPETHKRMINWKRLYQNRWLIEQRWRRGSCVTRMLPTESTPESELHTGGIYCTQFDKFKIVTGSRDWSIKVWDVATGRCKKTIRVHNGSVLCLQFDDEHILSGSSDTTVALTDLVTGQAKHVLRGHFHSVLGVKFVGKTKLVSCSKDSSLRLWDRTTGECLRLLDGHEAAVNAIQWHDTRIVSASGDRTVKIWDVDSGVCLRTLKGHTRGVACVEFDGHRIVSGSSDETVRIWDAESGDCVFTLMGHTQLVRTLQFNSQLNRIISGCYDGHLKLWDLKEGKLQKNLGQATEGRIFNIKFDFSKIMCCSNLTRLVVYDFAHGIDTSFLQ
ncbi:WD40 repeat-like protein [Rhizopus microsporus]|uniref:WD40 repeat-like protein n=1 Tax=Rhizopus microsporus TaxID=58291 RepID=A0A1X0RY03_RHIZD|nr:WD40 repeat-like protein [Rhizopus microsporus]